MFYVISKKSSIIFTVLITCFLLLGYLTSQHDVNVDDSRRNPGIHGEVKNYQKGVLARMPTPHSGTSEDHRQPAITAGPVSYIAPVFECTKPGTNKSCDTMVLTTTNTGFLDITENMLESIKRMVVPPNITIIAEDDKSYKRFTVDGGYCIYWKYFCVELLTVFRAGRTSQQRTVVIHKHLQGT
ncbi:uncharacterized protein LOC117305271 isoform X5 [Asterias rubens]|uniref:uncharacterized protein LOC117305271 isoform X5 n=1 Tax=Asterias rubens TaxID=7604 RepID=UPI001455686F|nr:uncharacterized protein LOC117305271 isoform X5 [Asterias rubens]